MEQSVNTATSHSTTRRDWWGRVQEGFGRLRDTAAGALTRFKPGAGTQLPAAADIDVPATPAHGGWGLVGGDVFEDDKRVVVRLELPGMDRKDFDVQVRGDALVVRGEKRFEQERTEGRWRVMQCAYGHFERHVPLPVPVKSDAARAVYKDGVLKVELPKSETAKPKALTVQIN